MQQPRFRILIVDSDQLLRESLYFYFFNHPDFDAVGSAGDGHQALVLCQVHDPHIILTGFDMPDMDGIDLLRQMRQHCETAVIVVLAQTKFDGKMKEAIEVGATGWIEKGILITDLVEALLLAGYKNLTQTRT